MEELKQYFLPGDLVILRQNISNIPEMYVVKKVNKTVSISNVKNDLFQGILCRWFTKEGLLQEAIFNTKDLRKLTK